MWYCTLKVTDRDHALLMFTVIWNHAMESCTVHVGCTHNFTVKASLRVFSIHIITIIKYISSNDFKFKTFVYLILNKIWIRLKLEELQQFEIWVYRPPCGTRVSKIKKLWRLLMYHDVQCHACMILAVYNLLFKWNGEKIEETKSRSSESFETRTSCV